MYCGNCGTQNPDGAVFCSSCGKSLKVPNTAQDKKTWIYLVNNQQFGPADEDKMRELLSSRLINVNTPVWTAGMTSWAPLASTPLIHLLTGLNNTGAGMNFAATGVIPAPRQPAGEIPWTLQIVRVYGFILGGIFGILTLISVIGYITGMSAASSFSNSLYGALLSSVIGNSYYGAFGGLACLIFLIILVVFALPAWGFLSTAIYICKRRPAAQVIGIIFTVLNMLLFLFVFIEVQTIGYFILFLIMFLPFLFLLIPPSGKTFNSWRGTH